MKLLFVDDESDILELIDAALDFEDDVEAIYTTDGKEAIQMVLSQRFDMIILDMMMPQPDGPAILAEVRKKAAEDGTRVVMCTANTTPEAAASLISLGAHKVLHKPFDPLRLADTLRSILQS
jgi:two-component system, OmpR family, response regulator